MESGKILVSHDSDTHLLKLEGDVRLTLCTSIDQYMQTIFEGDEVKDVIVDLLDAEGMDSTTLGLLAKLAIYTDQKFHLKPTLFCTDQSLLQIIESMGIDDLFDIVEQTPKQLDAIDVSEVKPIQDNGIEDDIQAIRRHVLEAHKLLALLNPSRSAEFMNLIESLEDAS
ncbi:MAG: STAS domain-containing protein [bacterium]